MKDLKLTVELVPKPLWGRNLRSELSEEEWRKLARISYKKAGYVCEVCGGKGRAHPVECHEVWRYEENYTEKIGRQVLTGFISLCPDCHAIKHFGRTGTVNPQSEVDRLVGHAVKVNGIRRSDFYNHVEEQFSLWNRRNKLTWETERVIPEEYKR